MEIVKKDIMCMYNKLYLKDKDLFFYKAPLSSLIKKNQYLPKYFLSSHSNQNKTKK